ncbi:hypothetical protein Q5741_05165 [Paenibacillus sp. JX-17]|uniref:DUF2802 domain-containing protein n=1 Tax=Paenibacillus lacisoli TaxID=3064525 RepID=A0ABT9C973_9BACL|nr:hypothetical protein [Paenibacillus sp. JX-17]MDO7905804.1 hypothetical protein [Paenibacillus sp. JX-17]
MEPWQIIVLLGAVAVVYALLLPKRAKEPAAGEQIVKNVEATLEQYLAEIERDNDEIIALVADLKQDHAAKQAALQEQVAEMRQRVVQLEQQAAGQDSVLSQLREDHAAARQSLLELAYGMESGGRADEPQQAEEEPPLSPKVRERYPELFQLYEQGKSLDAIGKQIGLQRGEIQLILQLAKQEEAL